MKNMSIKARITLGLGLILLFAVLNAGFSVRGGGQLVDSGH